MTTKGKHKYVCSIDSHPAAGMKGVLLVTSARARGSSAQRMVKVPCMPGFDRSAGIMLR